MKVKSVLIDGAAILAGCALVAAGLDVFVLPNNFSPGGVSGLAAVLAHFLPVSVGVLAFCINVPLLIAAWRVLGFAQLSRTLAATAVSSALIDLFSTFLPKYSGNPLLAAALGGVLIGAGIGLLFLRGISTGGTDLLSILLVRAFPNLAVGSLLLLADASVVLVTVLVFRDIEIALYSFVILYVSAKLIDGIMDGANYAKVIYVISSRGETICEALNTHLNRGVTVIPGKGGYTGEDKQILITVTRQNVLSQTLALIKMTDPESFSFVVNAAEVHGEGFRRYRADISGDS